MDIKQCYIGFKPLLDTGAIVDALTNDPPDCRWRLIRDIYRLADQEDSYDLTLKIQDRLNQVQDFRIQSRLILALHALRNPVYAEGYVLVKGKGAFHESDLKSITLRGEPRNLYLRQMSLCPVVDFHVHPQLPDMKLFVDMRLADVSIGVILATDTDPSDLDRTSIRDSLYRNYASCNQSRWLNFEQILSHLRVNLYSNTHVTNKDLAAWVDDYPGILYGFGSVNLSKDRTYVARKLEEIASLGLRGVNLLPYAQFFNPSENDNIDLLFKYCRATDSIVVSHSGCGKGPFDILELSRDSNPKLWEPVLRKYPDVPLVLSHCGSFSAFIPGIWLCEALKLGKDFRNVYADISAVEWVLENDTIVREIRKTITFDRILFGTDYPWPLASGVSLACLVSSIRANRHLTEKEKRKVLGENAIRLLGIA
ncbi:MAG: amidohydrolase family protein [Deltaproteobacteria bacterium]|nr:amidohydrolase family protein [Deltaproteobacteria bacterium]